ncbi:hypothetical protein R3P38DRAFT_543326 [Favolaschia claudopus]|uniref:Uncharacterized protein n=1 Tax=Favolaschia claudopus TaxID=2862362 RepID=A0AAW0CHU0_9AGAR
MTSAAARSIQYRVKAPSRLHLANIRPRPPTFRPPPPARGDLLQHLIPASPRPTNQTCPQEGHSTTKQKAAAHSAASILRRAPLSLDTDTQRHLHPSDGAGRRPSSTPQERRRRLVFLSIFLSERESIRCTQSNTMEWKAKPRHGSSIRPSVLRKRAAATPHSILPQTHESTPRIGATHKALSMVTQRQNRKLQPIELHPYFVNASQTRHI